jgi:mono/diheme cytochrome c family protein
MLRTRKLVLPVVLLVAALMAFFPAVAGAEPPADAANGQRVWQTKLCMNCHGANGEGKYAGPLAGTARTAQEAIAQVRSPRMQMPMFNAQQITDQEITDIIDYMKTLQRPASFQPQRVDVPANAPQGQTLFAQKRCYACHGDFSMTAGFIVQSGRRTLTDAQVEGKIRAGQGMMPRFSEQQVSQAEAQAIAAYLRPIVEARAAGTPAQLPTTGADPSVLTAALSLLGLVSVAAGMALRRARRS